MANQRKDNAAGKRSPMSFNQQCQARVQQVALAGATQPGCSCYKLSKIVKKFWVLLRKLRLRIRSLRIDKPHWRLLCQKHRQFTSTASQSGTGFFGSFLRDRHPAKCTPGEHKKKFAGDRSAHPWAPLLDSFFYTDSIRSDVDTFKLLYGLRPHQISLLCDKTALRVLEYHATVVSNSDKVREDSEEAFLSFVRAIEAGGFFGG